MTKLTDRQREVLAYVARCHVVSNGYDRSVLVALERKGLVYHHCDGVQNSTWTLTEAGKKTTQNDANI
jgi:hypothetical protein